MTWARPCHQNRPASMTSAPSVIGRACQATRNTGLVNSPARQRRRLGIVQQHQPAQMPRRVPDAEVDPDRQVSAARGRSRASSSPTSPASRWKPSGRARHDCHRYRASSVSQQATSPTARQYPSNDNAGAALYQPRMPPATCANTSGKVRAGRTIGSPPRTSHTVSRSPKLFGAGLSLKCFQIVSIALSPMQPREQEEDRQRRALAGRARTRGRRRQGRGSRARTGQGSPASAGGGAGRGAPDGPVPHAAGPGRPCPIGTARTASGPKRPEGSASRPTRPEAPPRPDKSARTGAE